MGEQARANFMIRAVAVLALLTLVGCGYKPLYGSAKTGFGNETQTGIHIPAVTSRTEQLVRNALLDELALSGIRAKSRHDLKILVNKKRVPFALRSDESPTRYDVNLKVVYELRRSGEKKNRIVGQNQGRASYNVVASDYTNIVSENAATRRAAALLARQVIARLAVFFDAAAK